MKRIVVGITGATGVVAGVRLLERLQGLAEVHLVISEAGRGVLAEELGMDAEALEPLAAVTYDNARFNVPIASGSFVTHGMVIAPCSMKTVSGVATSYADTLLVRAADVCLKQRRPLIVAPRETPLHAGHLRQLAQIADLGGVIAPFMPAFYHDPQTIDHLLDHWAGLVLDLLGIEHATTGRYAGAAAGVGVALP